MKSDAKYPAGLSPEITEMIAQHPSLEVVPGKEKLKCSLTGHEMPFKLELIKAYINGKKYKRKLTISEFNYKKYEPHLVPSEKKWFKERNQLFCKLTLRHLNQDPHHVLRHVTGRRFKTALARWEECQRTGEVFKPRGGSRNLKKGPVEPEEEESSEDEDERAENSDHNESSIVDEMLRNFEEEEEEEQQREGDQEEEDDSLEDLYPKEDFEPSAAPGGESEGEEVSDQDSDSEFEDDEDIPEAKPVKKTKPPPPKKRKAPASAAKDVPVKKVKANSTTNKNQKKKKKTNN